MQVSKCNIFDSIVIVLLHSVPCAQTLLTITTVIGVQQSHALLVVTPLRNVCVYSQCVSLQL
jgi:hypothetical protein